MIVSKCLSCENCADKENCSRSFKSRLIGSCYKSNSDAQFKEDTINFLAESVDYYTTKYNECMTEYKKIHKKKIDPYFIEDFEAHKKRLRYNMNQYEYCRDALLYDFAQGFGIMGEVCKLLKVNMLDFDY